MNRMVIIFAICAVLSLAQDFYDEGIEGQGYREDEFDCSQCPIITVPEKPHNDTLDDTDPDFDQDSVEDV